MSYGYPDIGVLSNVLSDLIIMTHNWSQMYTDSKLEFVRKGMNNFHNKTKVV